MCNSICIIRVYIFYISDPEHDLGRDFYNRFQVSPNCFTLNHNEKKTVLVSLKELVFKFYII